MEDSFGHRPDLAGPTDDIGVSFRRRVRDVLAIWNAQRWEKTKLFFRHTIFCIFIEMCSIVLS